MAEAFTGIPKIQYEGPECKNPLAFKHYNAEEVVEGKTMADHLRFSVAFWHCFRNGCTGPLGQPTRLMAWDDGTESLESAKSRIPALFEFSDKLGVNFFCSHDRDIAPEGETKATEGSTSGRDERGVDCGGNVWDKRTPGPAATLMKAESSSDRVLIVHGRDEGTKAMVARYLERLLGHLPVILNDEINAGRTIIEKLEAYGDPAYVIVVLTPDDIGGPAGSDEMNPRARQNVLLEWGFYVGRLGRDRVCVLRKSCPELPSDVDGVLYVPVDDAGAWQLRLARELKHAGFAVCLDRLVG